MAQFGIETRTIDVAPGRTEPINVVFACGQWTVGAVQIVAEYNVTGSWTATVKQSIDGRTPVAFATALSTSSAPYMTPPQDLSGVAYVHVSLSVNGTAGRLTVSFLGKSD